MRRLASLLLAALALPVTGPSLLAQSGSDLVTRGVAAYHAVRYDGAAELLRRALDGRPREALPDSLRAIASGYLAASEFFRGRRDAATAAAREAFAADPAYRPDTLVFPPDVTGAFETVRRGTRYVRIRVPADTTIAAGDGEYALRLYASAPHAIAAELIFADTDPPRRLYDGPIHDSLDLAWRAADAPQSFDGRLVVRVTSPLPEGGTRVVRRPLAVRVTGGDTLPHPPAPPDSLLLPEHAPGRPPVLALTLGVLGGAAAVALPTLVAEDGAGSPARFAVGGALSVAGLVALITGSRGAPLPANVAANRAVRDTWRQEMETVRRENAQRRRVAAWRITADSATSVEEHR